MSEFKNIHSTDLSLYPVIVLPGFLAFLFLGMIGSGNEWVYWIMFIGGWYLSSLIWWHLYKYFVINRLPPSRKIFYVYCILAQLGLAVLVLMFIKIQYAI